MIEDPGGKIPRILSIAMYDSILLYCGSVVSSKTCVLGLGHPPMGLARSNAIFRSWGQEDGNYIIGVVLLKDTGALALFPYLIGFLDAIKETPFSTTPSFHDEPSPHRPPY